jgi:hypothetical protein
MDGPDSYFDKLRGSTWDVKGIKDGAVSESVDETGRRNMTYNAIDFDRNRLYFQSEGGGFEDDVYDP